MFYRSAVILSGINVLILLLSLGAMVLIASTRVHRLELAYGHFRVFLSLEGARLALAQALEEPGTTAAKAEGLVEVVGLLNEVRANDAFLDPATATALEDVDEGLSGGQPRQLDEALSKLDSAMQSEEKRVSPWWVGSMAISPRPGRSRSSWCVSSGR